MKKQFSLMRTAKYFVSASVLIILAGIVVLIAMNFNYGIDFAGGSVLTLDLKQTVTNQDLDFAHSVGVKYVTKGDVIPSISANTQLVLRYQDSEITGEDAITVREAIVKDIQAKYPAATLLSFDRVGAVAGDELRRNAIISISVACVLMLIYVWLRFELVFGFAAIIALVHDVAIMTAFMLFFRVELNSTFVAALLTIIGYSMNDTIVVFDRIRENNKKLKTMTKAQIIDRSVLETLRRTINVSMTSFITITTLYILGVQTIKEFAFPLMVGIISGTYSSVLIAAPIWMWIHDAYDKRRKAKLAAKKQLKGQHKPSKSKA